MLTFIYVAIVLQIFFFSITMNILGPYLSSIIETYKISNTAAGFMALLQNFGGAIAIALLAFIIHKFRQTNVLPFAVAGFIAALFGISMQPVFVMFMAFYLLLGMSMGVLDSLANSIAADIFFEKRKFSVGLLHIFYGIGAIISPFVSNITEANNLSWSDAYRFAAIIFCVLLVIYIIALVLSKKAVAEATTSPAKAKSGEGSITLKQFLSDRRVQLIIVGMFTFGCAQGGLTVWSKRYLESFTDLAFSPSLILTAYWVGTLISRLLAMSALRKVPLRSMLLWGHSIYVVLTTIAVLYKNPLVMIILIGIGSLANGFTVPVSVDLISGWYRSNTGHASNVVFVSFFSGLGIAPTLMGIVADAASMQIALLIPALLPLFAALAAYFIPKDNLKELSAN